MRFEGFTAEDFEVYRPSCRTSAVYTLKRRAVKDKLRALSAQLLAQLEAQLVGLSVELSDEAPGLVNNRSVDSQWLCLQRDPEARAKLRSLLEEIQLNAPDALDIAPHHKHAHLAVVVDQEGLETSLRLHRRASVDRENLSTRLKEGWARDAFAALLRDCGEGYVLGPAQGRALPDKAIAAVAGDDVAQVMETCRDCEWLVVGARTSIDDAVALAGDLAPAAAQRIEPLIPLYRFAAWSPENDHIAARKAIKAAEVERKQAGFKPGDKVRILSGLWTGRTGSVEEIDKKGKLKVVVGLVSVRIDASDVTPA